MNSQDLSSVLKSPVAEDFFSLRRVLRVMVQVLELLELAFINCDSGNSRDNRCSMR